MSTQPKQFAFVLMPIRKEFEDVYKLGIKSACEDAGAYCERVDEQNFTGSILDRIHNQISKADIIVADMTGQNPNVFYEVGYAHALGKPVFLLTRDVADIPFDLKHYPHIVYEGSISSLKDKLESKIRWYVDHPAQKPADLVGEIELYLYGERLAEGGSVTADSSYSRDLGSGTLVELKLAVHNATTSTIRHEQAHIAIVLPDKCKSIQDGDCEMVTLPQNRTMIQLPLRQAILPNGWAPFNVTLLFDRIDPFEVFQSSVKIIGEIKSTEFSFILWVNRK